jgi:hypothetical protein
MVKAVSKLQCYSWPLCREISILLLFLSSSSSVLQPGLFCDESKVFLASTAGPEGTFPVDQGGEAWSCISHFRLVPRTKSFGSCHRAPDVRLRGLEHIVQGQLLLSLHLVSLSSLVNVVTVRKERMLGSRSDSHTSKLLQSVTVL